MKIIARNLAVETTESALKALFAPFGPIQYCNLVLDKETGASKGFGFIEMPKPADAKVAIKSLNNKIVDGAKIRVKRAEPKSSTMTQGNSE